MRKVYHKVSVTTILILLATGALSQSSMSGGNASIRWAAGAPAANSCPLNTLYINTTNSAMYVGASDGTCTLIGSGTTITGSGTANTVAKFTGTNAIGNSSLTDDGSKILTTEPFGIGTNAVPNGTHQIASDQASNCTTGTYMQLELTGSTSIANRLCIGFNTSTLQGVIQALQNAVAFKDLALEPSGGNVLLGPNITATNAGNVQGGTTNTANTFQSGVDANTTGASATLTVRGENVTAGGSNNLAGGSLVLAAGIGTGTSTPATVKIQSSPLGLAAAATQNALVTRYVTHVKAGSTTSAQATSLLNIASAANTTWGLKLLIHVQLISSTPNVCGTTQEFSLTGTNNNGAFGTVAINAGTAAAGTLSTLCSTGTLTLAVTATAANPSVISVTPTWGTITSITSATITVEIWNPSQQEIALL